MHRPTVKLQDSLSISAQMERGWDLLLLGGVSTAFFIPLKLFFAYLTLIPVLLYWVVRGGPTRTNLAPEFVIVPLAAISLWAPFSSIFGLAPGRSIADGFSFLFLLLIMLFFSDIARDGKGKYILLALIAGQSLAALHSVYDAAYPKLLPRFFLGQVTESGQLGLVIPVAVGMLFSLLKATSTRARTAFVVLFVGFHALFVMTGFHQSLPADTLYRVLPLITLGALLAYAILFSRWAPRLQSPVLAFVLIALPLLFSALLVNLKRGPWLGTTLGLLLLLGLTSKRFIGPLMLGIVGALLLITPIRERISQSSRDFFIAGGRSEIWDIGAELTGRFPLGVGIKNSRVLREYSTLVPPELTHFHNNFLNITVELGWIGLALYLWFLLGLGRLALAGIQSRDEKSSLRDNAPRHDSSPLLLLAIGCGLISWQIAGLVEYNVGDSEVSLAAFTLIGVGCQLWRSVTSGLRSRRESDEREQGRLSSSSRLSEPHAEAS